MPGKTETYKVYKPTPTLSTVIPQGYENNTQWLGVGDPLAGLAAQESLLPVKLPLGPPESSRIVALVNGHPCWVGFFSDMAAFES